MRDTNYEAIKILISVLPKETRDAFMEKAGEHVDPDVRWLSHKITYKNIGGLRADV